MNRIRFACGILAVIFILQACDIFTTRDPAPPTTGTSSITPPDRPEIVLSNLQSAITQANTDNYLRSFADTTGGLPPFRFVPTAEALASYPGTFRDWSIADERNYFLNLGKPVNFSPSLNFDAVQRTSVSSDSVSYTMNYDLYYPHNRQGIPERVLGKIQLDLKPDRRGLWYIVTWHDYKTTSDSTWSYLKARFKTN